MFIIHKALLEKIYDKVDIDEETMCFRYQGGTNGKRYGRIYARRKMYGVH